MGRLKNRKIILGLTGSIAAYKAASLTRFLIKEQAEVRVIMTSGSMEFISSLTMSTLSRNEVVSSMSTNQQWNNHVELGLWGDVFLVAPCTANSLGKMANGLADNMLIASYLSAKCPVFIAPAMDLDMWKHPSTVQNLKQLEKYGNTIVPVDHGELASGLVGDGRMAEPEAIVELLVEYFSKKKDLIGKNVLITAGPTHEPIDPVRYISNHSTGKMGVAIAMECAARGANVDIVLGPVKLNPDHPGIKCHSVQSASEMFENAIRLYPACDIAILAAAVADYTPSYTSGHKIKKSEGEMSISLKRTKDIAGELGKIKNPGQINVGFALETENEIENAIAKLNKKNFDFIVLNSMRDKGAGFKHDTNQVTIILSEDQIQKYELKSKVKVAEDIINQIVNLV